MTTLATVEEVVLEGVPADVSWVVETLSHAGHESVLVGGCVRDLLGGRVPADFDVATAAPADAVLALFRRAIPIGGAFGTVMIPTPGGPVDATTYRGDGGLESDLGHRDFTINAIAYDPRGARLWDPFQGRADLAKGLLRAVRNAEDRLAEDPLRALRAARLVATLDLEIDGELERALPSAGPGLRKVAAERMRRELSTMLMADQAARGLELLRRTGLEKVLAPRAAPDAPRVVASLPAELELRLAGWLRGARATSILRKLRFPRRTTERVERLLRGHPIEADLDPTQEGAVRRRLRSVGEAEAPALLALRRAEADGDTEVLARLDALEDTIARLQRQGELALQRHQLALGGREVMEILEATAGPTVGRALHHLTDLVVEDPEQNTSERLREHLVAWAREQKGESE